MIDDYYDWSPLGRSFWARAAMEVKATPLQARFSCAKLRGLGHTAAAREAGVGRTAKSSGYEMSKNPKCIALLTMAQTANGSRPKHLEDAKPEGEMTPGEAKKILTAIARNNDPVLKIRAVEALGKIIRKSNAIDASYRLIRLSRARSRPPGITVRSF